jgi:hypothetical protein
MQDAWLSRVLDQPESRYFTLNLIASCAQPDTGGPLDEVSGR